MANKFTRNITNTKIKGDKKEPLYTNNQNDILSDDEDIAIRNKDEYHLLTDNLKTDGLTVEHISNPESGSFFTVTKTGKNSLRLTGNTPSVEEAEQGIAIRRIMSPQYVTFAINYQVPIIIRNQVPPIVKGLIPKFSTKTEAEDGTNNDTIMTPIRVKEVIDKQVPSILELNPSFSDEFYIEHNSFLSIVEGGQSYITVNSLNGKKALDYVNINPNNNQVQTKFMGMKENGNLETLDYIITSSMVEEKEDGGLTLKVNYSELEEEFIASVNRLAEVTKIVPLQLIFKYKNKRLVMLKGNILMREW